MSCDVAVQKLDAGNAKHESVQRELEAALEAQKLAHAEVQSRTSPHRAGAGEHPQTCMLCHSLLICSCSTPRDL